MRKVWYIIRTWRDGIEFIGEERDNRSCASMKMIRSLGGCNSVWRDDLQIVLIILPAEFFKRRLFFCCKRKFMSI